MLSLLSKIYARVISARNYLYDRGVFETYDLGARTISVGNITSGGTGKTPLTALIAEMLSERGEKVCILTRGYGRRNAKQRVLVTDGKEILADAATAGDEPFELAKKLFGEAIIIADADRVAASEWAKRKFGVTAFVLDDGFQHRKAKRHLDIVCIDATDPFGGGEMLPAGNLREPLNGLDRADVIVLIGECSAASRQQIEDLTEQAKIFEACKAVTSFTTLAGEIVDRPTDKLLPFCGLGMPRNFFDLLEKEKLDIADEKAFRDHHNYTQQDINELISVAKNHGATALITTAKDAVKLSTLQFEIPCYVVEIEIRLSDKDGFKTLI